MKLERSCGAVVFTRTEEEPMYVLVRSHKGHYGFPKGHMETGETEEETAEGPVVVRGYHSTERSYLPTTVIMSDADMREMLLDRALKELEEFQAKYRHLAALAGVFEAIEQVERQVV